MRNPDVLDALMVTAIASWEIGRYRPYDLDELACLEEDTAAQLRLSLNLRRALGQRTPLDLEWTVLLVPALTELLDQATARFGGTWPVTTVATALSRRVPDVELHADTWAEGVPVTPGSVLRLLMETRTDAPDSP